MKKHIRFPIMLTFVIYFTSLATAQIFIDGIGLDRSDIKFCEVLEVDYNAFKKRLSVIRETERALLIKTNYEMDNKARQVFIDFGQAIDWKNPQRFQQFDGEDIQFNGAMEALNLLVSNGWTYHTRTESHHGEVRLTRYLLERNLAIKTEKPLQPPTDKTVHSTMILGDKVGFILSKPSNWIIPINSKQKTAATIYLSGHDEQTSPAIIEAQVTVLDMDTLAFHKASKEAGYRLVDIDIKSGIKVYEFKQFEENVFIQVAYIVKGKDLFSFQFSTAELAHFEKYKGDFRHILMQLKEVDAATVFED